MEEQIIEYTVCPVCSSADLHQVLQVRDFTVSGKLFDIWECTGCRLRFTQHVPAQQSIGSYYQSSAYISHTDSSEGLINRIYHVVRKRTLSDKRKLILRETGMANGRLLDIGAGTGAFVHHMTGHHWQVTGLEPDEATRERAKKLNQADLLPADDFYGLEAGSYNAITMWHVLEHVHDLHNYMKQLSLLLKPGGKIFIAVPNYTSFDAGFYRENWAAYDVPRHLYHFSPSSMRALLALHGLTLQSARQMRYDPFYISLLSERNRKGNLVRGFFVALWSTVVALFKKERCSSLIYIISKT